MFCAKAQTRLSLRRSDGIKFDICSVIVVIGSLLIINRKFSMNVLFQALKMYLNCLMHPCTLIKHVQFVNNVLMYIVLL